MKTPFFRVVLAIVRKDLQTELRSRELVTTMGLFALMSILVFSFSLELDRVAREESVSGILWVTIIFASILGLNRSMSTEREGSTLDAMLLSPIDRAAIFVGKLIGNLVFTLIIGLVMLPIMTILFNFPLLNPYNVLTMILGIFGFSIVGTLLATMTVQTRARESLLPIALLPVALPLILAAVRASTGILNEAPISDWIGWLQILAIVDIIYLVLCYLMFAYVIEE